MDERNSFQEANSLDMKIGLKILNFSSTRHYFFCKIGISYDKNVLETFVVNI